MDMPQSASELANLTGTGERVVLPANTHAIPVVHVCCEDPVARASLEALLRCAGWAPEMLESLAELEDETSTLTPRCLVFCAPPSGRAEPELLERIAAKRQDMPVILVTRDVDVSMIVRLMKAGASEVLFEPFGDGILVSAVERALEQSRAVLGEAAEVRAIRARYASLSRREREIMALVAVGRLNKQIAGELRISEITVKAHRGRVMRKMAARSLPQLVIMYLRLGADASSRG